MTTSITIGAAPRLSVKVIRRASQLADLAPCWNGLARDVPFRTLQWAETWWQHYQAPHRELFTVLVTDESDQVVGIGPWYIESSVGAGRVVRFLGSGEVCSDYLTILCQPALERDVAARLADWLATEAAERWHLVDLAAVESSEAVVRSFGRRMTELGHLVDTQVDLSCWRVELPGSWEQFLAALSKSRRSRTRMLLRDLVDSGSAVAHEVRSAEELRQAFEILMELHQKRRRSLSQPGCFASPRFAEFHRSVAARFLDEGWLRMLWIEMAGRPASIIYAFVGGPTVYYYQGGFDPDLAGASPGWLSQAASLRSAIAEGAASYDFLRGHEPYKASWGARPRELVRVRVVGRQRSARARYAMWRGLKRVKRWARNGVAPQKG